MEWQEQEMFYAQFFNFQYRLVRIKGAGCEDEVKSRDDAVTWEEILGPGKEKKWGHDQETATHHSRPAPGSAGTEQQHTNGVVPQTADNRC